eukprot:TRINITY_DN17661_c0_g1_i1.p1 TRINITY_DN17661_c0_g1~~TRINITY_DN17661_c0_g1_i1.p1  ORF type:complete len:217 (+),score=47.72 TRINITY_DN17661_c0_g1_i1:115-765(+)
MYTRLATTVCRPTYGRSLHMWGLKYKLTYFDFAYGRGEAIRAAFRLTGTLFDDSRVPLEQWPALKESTPFATLPLLEVEGKTVSQSNAILVYIGKEVGLYPVDNWEAAKVDEVLSFVEELQLSFKPWRREQEPDLKEKYRQELEVAVPRAMDNLERLHKDSGCEVFWVGDKITVADLKMWSVVDGIQKGRVPGGPIEHCHRLMRIYEEVETALANV